MSDLELQLRCQRCGTQMDLRDPVRGTPWVPQQYWVCPACGRHFWTTYPQPTVKPAEEKPAAAAKPAAATPAKPAAPPAAPQS